jgi:hypothetical protein
VQFLGAGHDDDQNFCLRRHLIRCAAPAHPTRPTMLSSSARTSPAVTPLTGPDQIRAQGRPIRPTPAKPTRMPSGFPLVMIRTSEMKGPDLRGWGAGVRVPGVLPVRAFPNLCCRRGEAPRAKSPAFSVLTPATVENPGAGLAPGFAGRASG